MSNINYVQNKTNTFLYLLDLKKLEIINKDPFLVFHKKTTSNRNQSSTSYLIEENTIEISLMAPKEKEMINVFDAFQIANCIKFSEVNQETKAIFMSEYFYDFVLYSIDYSQMGYCNDFFTYSLWGRYREHEKEYKQNNLKEVMGGLSYLSKMF